MIQRPDALDHRKLYRLPWSATDNIISWLEPTKQCNIHCHGCYSENMTGSHKSFQQIAHELDVFERYRQTDAVSIAGGDPLTHPGIVNIVRMVAKRGLKPIVNTNGFAMTKELLHDLKLAGAKGFTFHIDSGQKRPGWTGKNELELNELRLKYAKMVAAEGGLTCSFNATVYGKNLHYVPEIVKWGQEHIDIVQVLVFIAFRAIEGDHRFDYYLGDRKMATQTLAYGKATPERADISAHDVIAEIRKTEPDWEPCSYLNGTEKFDSFKWLMTLRVGDRDAIAGYAGPKFIELAQVLNHLQHGRYLGYVTPRVHRRAKWMLALGAIDGGLRKAFGRWVGTVARNPLKLFRPLHLQSIMVIQPVDLLVDGRQSMCDACPDMTVHGDELVWSCRLDERLKFGAIMRTVPKEESVEPEPALP